MSIVAMSLAPRQARGFTLLELLVAMGIFGIIGAMALGGLNAIVGQTTIATEQTSRLTRLQRAVRLMTNDFGGLQPRFVRDELGDPGEPPLLVSQSGDEIRGSRGGWRNPANLPFRGTLQRFQYRLEDGKLLREYWPVMDHGLQEKPRSEELLDGVKKLQVWYYASATERYDRWPPTGKAGQTPSRPRGIQIILDLEDWGEIERWVEVAQ